MRRLPLSILLLAAVSACAFPRQVHRVAIDYNDVVASTSNALTFLNIVRARERHPLHFTTLSALRGSITVDAGASVGVPVGRARSGADLLSSARIASGPSFDVAILNSQEFQRGILQPVSSSLIGYFLEQGWAPEFVAALFVERVEYVASADQPGYPAGAVVARLENGPDQADGAAFGHFLSCWRLRATATPRSERPLVEFDALRGGVALGEIRTLDGTAFDVIEADPGDGRGARRFIARISPGSSGLGLARVPGQGDRHCTIPTAERGPLGLVVGELQPGAAAPPGAPLHAPGHVTVGEHQLLIGDARLSVDTRIVLRSPLGLFYFLGAYARAAEPYLVSGRKLIDVRPGAGFGAFTSAELAGRTWHIDGRDNGYSLQTLAILQQIVNLQKSAADLPVTGAVQIVR